ncbi:hypothetical protein [Paratractidigestivibacter sp.]|uniref:hypothetical protein n=1 Tax=Paratractidigestivibacter sp. TaxID=2847316 RepID=UPI002ABE073A|nr:hypothetical protein [Paratractidigestivibacter sp.]
MGKANLSRRGFIRGALFAATGIAATALGPGVETLAGETEAETGGEVLTVRDGDGLVDISVKETDGVRTVTAANRTTGVVNAIVYDINNSIVSSSYTGETVELVGDLAVADEKPVAGNARSRTSYSTKNISYAQIKSVVGTVTTVAALASALLAFVAGATMAAKITGLVNAVGTAVNNVASPSSSHGVRVTISTTRYYRKGNHIPHRTVKQITGAALY